MLQDNKIFSKIEGFMKKIDKEKIKTWFVTGASSGIGYEICRQLLERNYNVIAVARRIPDFKQENALCLSVDVTKPETIEVAIEKSIERFGRIDVLSNNAGITANIACEDETLEHMKQIMEVNFFGTFNTINALLPYFRKNKNGTIISNSSQSGITPRLWGGGYCSSKHAIEGFTGVCWLETYKFCRVMTVEFGGYASTGIFDRMPVKEPAYDEYKNIKNKHKNFYYTYENDLKNAINILINTVEKRELPRRLMLGKDACIKTQAEINWLKKDLRNSKKYINSCSKYKIEITTDLIKRFINKVINNRL